MISATDMYMHDHCFFHDDVIKWKHIPRYWAFVRGIHRWLALFAGNSPVTGEFPHKGQWRGALMFYLICVWINDWVNHSEAGDLRRNRALYDVIEMSSMIIYRGSCSYLWWIDIQRMSPYYTGIFSISSGFFAFLWCMKGVFLFEIHSYEQILLFGELIPS